MVGFVITLISWITASSSFLKKSFYRMIGHMINHTIQITVDMRCYHSDKASGLTSATNMCFVAAAVMLDKLY